MRETSKTTTETNRIIWSNIASLLKKNKTSLKTLAPGIGIDYVSLRQMKHRNQKISTDTLKKIAWFFGVPVYYLTLNQTATEKINNDSIVTCNNDRFVNNEVYMKCCDGLFEKLPLSKETPQYIRRAVFNLYKMVSSGQNLINNQHAVGVPEFDEDCRVISAINEIKNCNGQEYGKLRANVFTILSLAREYEAFEEVLYICDDLYFSLPQKKDYEDIYIEDICDNISQNLIHRIGDKELSDDLLSTANAGAGCSPSILEYDPWIEAKNRFSELKRSEYNYRKKLRSKGVKVNNAKRGRPRNAEYEEALPPWVKD